MGGGSGGWTEAEGTPAIALCFECNLSGKVRWAGFAPIKYEARAQGCSVFMGMLNAHIRLHRLCDIPPHQQLPPLPTMVYGTGRPSAEHSDEGRHSSFTARVDRRRLDLFLDFTYICDRLVALSPGGTSGSTARRAIAPYSPSSRRRHGLLQTTDSPNRSGGVFARACADFPQGAPTRDTRP